jgi:DNA-binding NarL/FixJ family response regulator
MDPQETMPEPGFSNVLVAAETEGHGRVDREFLKKARIFAPRVVHSARAALDVLGRHGADLILCDGRLEDAKGLELVAAIKEHPRLRMIPVIMVSLETSREAVIEAARLGVCGYLLRPYSQAAFARYLALARAMRAFTDQAAAEMAQAAREVLSGRPSGDRDGLAVPAPPLPFPVTGAAAVLSPEEAPRLYRLGLRRLAGGEFEAAAQAFSRATAINVLYVEAHLGLAETFRARGDVRRYREAMKQAAAACARARRFEELRDRFADMLKADREGFNPFVALGNERLASRDYQDAVSAYGDALALTPDKGDIFLQMGKAYHFLRRKDQAIKAVTQAMECGGDSLEARSLLCRLTGRDPDAVPEMGQGREDAGQAMPWALRMAGLVAGLVTEGLYKLRRQAA